MSSALFISTVISLRTQGAAVTALWEPRALAMAEKGAAL